MQISRHAKGRTATAGFLALLTTAALSTAQPAQAQLTLTPAGTALGFSLSTFASGFPNSRDIGPLGIAFTTTGGVLVSDYPGNVRLFPTDTDGQSASSVAVAKNYGFANVGGLALAGGKIYMAEQVAGEVVQLNNDGTFNQNIVSGLGNATGLVANPANGHLFVSDVVNDIFEVDPIAKTDTPIVTGYKLDGLSLSPDGKILYGADDGNEGNGLNGHIYGFSTTTGNQVFDSSFIPGGIDGTASGFATLAGNIIANTNGGTLVEINLATDAQTLIATGGSRGDFATADPSNGTLLLTQTDSIMRLTPGAGGGFTPVPEASTVVSTGLLMLGGLGCLLMARKRTRKA